MSQNSAPDESARRRAGLINGFSAYLLWGVMPLLFAAAAPTGALELVSHRVIWSLVFCAILLVFTGGFLRTWQILRSPRLFRLLLLASVLIAINWTTFIYGVETNHLVEISLGYYLNPLISIGLGVVFLGEKLRPLQWTAVGFGLLAVIIVGIGLGRVPYLAFTVALSFGLYGLVKNKVGSRVGALEGMAVGTTVVAAATECREEELAPLLGILHDDDSRLADEMLARAESIPGRKINRNDPYGPADGVTHTLRLHGLANNLANVMIEVRNDLIETPAEQDAIAEELLTLLRPALARLTQAEVGDA